MSTSRITDAAVEAISRTLLGPAWDTFDESLRDTLRGIYREGLEAAEPHLTPALPTREQIADVLARHGFGDIRYNAADAAAEAQDECADAVLALLNGSDS